MSQLLVLYHAACRDGFCAAWCVQRRYPHAEFVACQYGAPVPEVIGRDVVMVDFSYPRPLLDQIADDAASLLILDHHKTAEESLRGFVAPTGSSVEIHFDMERSGAGMAWDHFHPGQPRPWIVDYVEDRDLWRHKLPNGPAVNAFISTIPFEFEAWYKASRVPLERAAELGEVVEDKIRQYVREVAKNARRVTFEGHEVPLVNAPQVDISELGSFLANGEAFAVGWWQRADGVFQYSLRSREPSDIDVSEIAKRHGGGGHRRAAGFQSDRLLF